MKIDMKTPMVFTILLLIALVFVTQTGWGTEIIIQPAQWASLLAALLAGFVAAHLSLRAFRLVSGS